MLINWLAGRAKTERRNEREDCTHSYAAAAATARRGPGSPLCVCDKDLLDYTVNNMRDLYIPLSSAL